MMVRHLTFAALCLAAWPIPAGAQTGTTEAPGLEPQVRRDLESLFQTGASLDRIAPYGQTAARARLRTRPYATSIVGICRRDEVIVDYAGPQPFADSAAANAVAPYGVSAEGWYRMLRDVRNAGSSYQGRPRDGECATLDGAGTSGWFVAPDVYVAAGGHRALAAAREQLDARRSYIRGCRENRQALQYCRGTIAGALEQTARIDRCDAAPRRFCFRLALTDDNVIFIRLRYNGRGEERIESIEIEGPPIMV